MPVFKKHKLAIAISLSLPLLILGGCNDDSLDPEHINAPDTYEFTSLTNPSVDSSVNYTEATSRYILIKELEYLIGSSKLHAIANTSGEFAAMALLNEIYSGGSSILKASDIYDADNITNINGIDTSLGKLQTDFSYLPDNINLKSELPGISAGLHFRNSDDDSLGEFLGWKIAGVTNGDETSDKMIQAWFKKIIAIAKKNEDIAYRSGGIDYKSLVTSFLSTSIPYFQVTSILLNPEIGLKADNTSQGAYTNLQHNWDLAFGYFGANSHYKLYGKNENSVVTEFDTNADGYIDLFTEYNFIHAQSAASIDATTTLAGSNYSQTIMQAFLNGRQLIDEHINNTLTDQELTKGLAIQASIIRTNWERAIAAELIHYLNSASKLALIYGGSDIIDALYDKYWAYAKSYSLALQFNPLSIISLDDLNHNDSPQINLGHAPEIRSSNLKSYQNKLLIARDHITDVYGFSEQDSLTW